MIRVLIVDDSPSVVRMLSYILSSDRSLHIVGEAANGEEAVRMTARLKPDIVTMDITMPVMDGFEATRSIMEQTPVPVVIVTSLYDPEEISLSFRAVEAGALMLLGKPVGVGHPAYLQQCRDLIGTVKAMAKVKVVRRKQRAAPAREAVAAAAGSVSGREIRMIAIGASTGGPPVLQTILAGLPKDLSVPVTIVQHITHGFTAGFASWLAETTGFPVRIPDHGEFCMPGTVYVAPDDVHLAVDAGGRILLSDDPPDNLLRPSIMRLFRSTAQAFREKAVGVLLTGMGRDGAEGLKMMRDAGAVTIAQDEDSSVVFGMNGEAVKLGAAQHILPPEGIVRMLTLLAAPKELQRQAAR